jgi:predicted GIY-YIG superfamily endonuclease
MQEPSIDLYEIYQLSDPQDQSIHYIGMSKDAQGRLKQHLTNKNGAVYQWVQELALAGKEPELTIIGYAPNKQEARMVEQYWIKQKGREFLLLNGVHNYEAIQRWEEEAAYNEWLRKRFANLPAQDMQEAIRMVKLAHSYIGRDRWEDTYEAVEITIRECGAKVSVIDQIKISFKVYRKSHIDGSKVEA